MTAPLRRSLTMLASLLLAAMLADFFTPAVSGQEPGNEAQGESLRFRRVYVPADRVDEWPVGNERYAPVDPDEFERLVDLARRTADSAPPTAQARLIESRYSARLEGDELVDGRATLEVSSGSDGATMLPLVPCGLAIRDVRWAGREEPARFGLGSNGRTGIVVEENGELAIDWSLGGRRDATGAIRFQLELPRCPLVEVTLDLPEGRRLSADQGVVTDEGPVEGSLRRWRLELSAVSSVELVVRASGEAPRREQLALARERLVYAISPRGVEVAAEFELDVHYEPLGQLEVELGPGLRLVEAVYGEKRLGWTLAASEADDGTQHVVLELPEPIDGTGRLIRLSATAEPQLASMWKLPAIVPRGVFWQEGSVTLRVMRPLVVEQLKTTDCRQTAMLPLAGSADGESLEMQLFSTASTIEVQLAEHDPPLHVSGGTTVMLDVGETTSESIFELTADEGSHFNLEADFSPQWTIDTVEAIPAGSVADWSVNDQKLTIQLARPVRLGDPLLLVVHALRLPPVLTEPVRSDELRLMRFRAAVEQPRLVEVRGTSAYDPRWIDATDAKWVEPADVPPEAAELFRQPPRATLLQLEEESGSVQVTLEAKRPRYEASIRIDASVSATTLYESAVIKCQPQGASIDRLLVHFSVARETAPIWTSGTAADATIRAERLAPEAAWGAPGGGETWGVEVPRSSGAIEIRATRKCALSDDTPVSLVALPEADSQSADVVVRSLEGAAFDLEHRRIKPLAAEPSTAERYSTVRAAFAYDPADDVDPTLPAALTVSTDEGTLKQSAAIVWRAALDTSLEPASTARHLATYWIENNGLASVTIEVPEFAQLRAAWVDGEAVGIDDPSGEVTLELPAAQRFPVVVVELVSDGEELGVVDRIGSPLPDLRGVPVLDRRWMLWLPPTHELFGVDSAWQRVGTKATSWAVRLFGVFARSPTSEPFNPLDREAIVESAPAVVSGYRARVAVDQFLHALGSPTPNDEGAASANRRIVLGQALARAERHLRDWDQLLVIDAAALAEAGVGPDTVIERPVAETPQQRGLSILQAEGLVLLVNTQAMLLTTVAGAAHSQHELSCLEEGVVFKVAPGDLESQLAAAVRGDLTHGMPLAKWRGEQVPPWNAKRIDQPSLGMDAVAGWRAYQLVGGSSDDEMSGAAALVVKRRAVNIAAWAILLVVAIVGWRRFADRAVVLIVAASVFGVAALWLPEAIAPLASAAMIGAVVCLLASAVGLAGTGERATEAEDSKSGSRSSSVRAATSSSLVLCLAVGLIFERADALEAANRVIRVAQILIPIDADRQPTGDNYHVPEAFYRDLRQRAAEAVDAPREWLLEDAHYQARLATEEVGKAYQVEEITAELDLHVFGHDVAVRLPWGRGVASATPSSATLDGRELDLDQRTDDGWFVVRIAEPGRHRLELTFQPAKAVDGQSVELKIPPLVSSRLELSLPSGAPRVVIPTARGSVARDELRQSLRAELGPTDQLMIRWLNQMAAGADEAPSEVEELVWFQIKPGSVVLETRFQFDFGDASVDHVEIVGDPRLRMLPVDHGDLPLAEVRNNTGNPQVWHFEFSRPVSGEVDLPITMLMTGTSGVGNLRLPRLEARGARTVSRQVAVTVDPTLAFEATGGEVLDAAAARSFAENWPMAAVAPQAIYELAPGSTDWSMSAHAIESHMKAEQRIALSFGRDYARVRAEAELTPVTGSTFRYRVAAPPELEIESISVLEEKAERVARWSRDTEGVITVFLTGAAPDEQTLSIDGRLPLGAKSRVDLPKISLAEQEVTSTELAIYRQAEVLVAVEESEGLERLADSSSAIVGSEAGHLVASFRVTDPSYAAKLVLSPNKPVARATQVTRCARDDGDWSAEVDVLLEVESGLVDTLSFSIPEQWPGPFQIEPPVPSTVVTSPRSDSRRLVIRPAAAIEGTFRVSIRGPYTGETAQRVGVPRIDLLDVGEATQFVVVPTQIELEQLAWDTSGLSGAPLPPEFQTAATDSGALAAYRVVSDDFEARLRSVDRLTGVAQQRLMDVFAKIDEQGRCVGIATFDVESAAAERCLLRMPDDYELVRVTVGGLQALGRAEGDGRWQIHLGSIQSPQRVEVIFRGPVQRRAGLDWTYELEVPRLGDLPIERTLWTVACPPHVESVVTEDGSMMGPLRMELLRLEAIDELIEQGSQFEPGATTEQTTAWYEPWARRLAGCRWFVTHFAATVATPEDRDAQAEVEYVDSHQTEIAERLKVGAILRRSVGEALVAQQPRELWRLNQFEAGGPMLRSMSPGGQQELVIRGHDPQAAGVWERIGATLAIVAAATALIVGVSIARSDPFAWLRRWPAAALVAVGIVWWLWLSPSALGLVIVACGLYFAWRWAWPAPASGGSTITRTDMTSPP